MSSIFGVFALKTSVKTLSKKVQSSNHTLKVYLFNKFAKVEQLEISTNINIYFVDII